jgi:hypothetical protein
LLRPNSKLIALSLDLRLLTLLTHTSSASCDRALVNSNTGGCDGASDEEDEGEASRDDEEGAVAALARRMARGGEEEEEGV